MDAKPRWPPWLAPQPVQGAAVDPQAPAGWMPSVPWPMPSWPPSPFPSGSCPPNPFPPPPFPPFPPSPFPPSPFPPSNFCAYLASLVGSTVTVNLVNGATYTGLLTSINNCAFITLLTCMNGTPTSVNIQVRDISTIYKS